MRRCRFIISQEIFFQGQEISILVRNFLNFLSVSGNFDFIKATAGFDNVANFIHGLLKQVIYKTFTCSLYHVYVIFSSDINNIDICYFFH